MIFLWQNNYYIVGWLAVPAMHTAYFTQLGIFCWPILVLVCPANGEYVSMNCESSCPADQMAIVQWKRIFSTKAIHSLLISTYTFFLR